MIEKGRGEVVKGEKEVRFGGKGEMGNGEGRFLLLGEGAV